MLAVQHALADRLVFSTIRQRFGGRLRFFVSAAAPLNHDIAQWFDAVGIIVLEATASPRRRRRRSSTAPTLIDSAPSGYRFPARKSESPRTARSCCAARV